MGGVEDAEFWKVVISGAIGGIVTGTFAIVALVVNTVNANNRMRTQLSENRDLRNRDYDEERAARALDRGVEDVLNFSERARNVISTAVHRFAPEEEIIALQNSIRETQTRGRVRKRHVNFLTGKIERLQADTAARVAELNSAQARVSEAFIRVRITAPEPVVRACEEWIQASVVLGASGGIPIMVKLADEVDDSIREWIYRETKSPRTHSGESGNEDVSESSELAGS